MSANKRTVEQFMEGYRRIDRAEVLSCLTDDIEWVVPGAFHRTGKAAFAKEVGHAGFIGGPTINVTRLIEENDVVIAEGTVRMTKSDGGEVNLVYCDVFMMQETKIKHLTSYLVEIK